MVQTTEHRVHKHLSQTLMVKFLFRTPQEVYPVQLVPTVSGSNRYSQPPNKGLGKKASRHNNNIQPSVSAIFAQTSSYPQSRNLGTGCPKLFCTACGEYDHWRKDCPYDCHCDNCDSDSHTTHMCRAPPKPSPTPSPQPVICIYCGSSDHRSVECSNHLRDNRGRSCTQPSVKSVQLRKTMKICHSVQQNFTKVQC